MPIDKNYHSSHKRCRPYEIVASHLGLHGFNLSLFSWTPDKTQNEIVLNNGGITQLPQWEEGRQQYTCFILTEHTHYKTNNLTLSRKGSDQTEHLQRLRSDWASVKSGLSLC